MRSPQLPDRNSFFKKVPCCLSCPLADHTCPKYADLFPSLAAVREVDGAGRVASRADCHAGPCGQPTAHDPGPACTTAAAGADHCQPEGEGPSQRTSTAFNYQICRYKGCKTASKVCTDMQRAVLTSFDTHVSVSMLALFLITFACVSPLTPSC